MLGQLKVYPHGFWCQPTLPSCGYNEEQSEYFCVFMYCRSISSSITLISNIFGQTMSVSEEYRPEMSTMVYLVGWLGSWWSLSLKKLQSNFWKIQCYFFVSTPLSWSSSFQRTCNYLPYVLVFTDLTINLRNSYQICNFMEKIHYPSYHMILTFVNEKLSCSSSWEI